MRGFVLAGIFLGLTLSSAANRACAKDAEIPPKVEKARFHHVHLNSMNPQESMIYYRKFFSAVPVKYRGVSPALLTDRSFIFYNQVDAAAPAELKSAIWHIGWGGVDGPSEHQWRKEAGAEFHTPLTELGNEHYMYLRGPDGELIEVWTGYKHNRFGHIHLLAEDVNATSQWYIDQLGLEARRREVPAPTSNDPNMREGRWANQVSADNVIINVFGKPKGPARWFPEGAPEKFEMTEGRVIDHLAFSYARIEPVLERMKASGVEIIAPIREQSDYRIKSFFVRAPDGVLVEIVQEKPIPEGIWED